MEEALMETGRRRRRVCNDVVRILVSIIVMNMLIWIVCEGYKLATYVRKDANKVVGFDDSYVALVFGVATVVCGFVYFIIGLTVLAELLLDFLAWLQGADKGTNNNQEKEQRTVSQVKIRASATTVSIVMLTCAIYHGYKFAAETPNGGMHVFLAFLIGFTTMAFGFIYFIIGISIVAESALYLSGKLQHKLI